MKSENENDTFYIFKAFQVGECFYKLMSWNAGLLCVHKVKLFTNESATRIGGFGLRNGLSAVTSLV